MNRNDVDVSKLSPMMVQYLEIKKDNEEAIIFFRVGDFYEMFFDDAIMASQLLELTLTGKQAGLDERIPMCGVPHHAYLGYAKKLVDFGYKVAICEQLENPSDAKGIVKRDIIQVLSKGTIINEEALTSNENNYIGYLMDIKYAYLISYCDVSTGESFTTLVSHQKLKVINEIKNIGITEILVNDKIDVEIINILKNEYKILVSIVDDKEELTLDYLFANVLESNEVNYIKRSFNILVTYLTNTQKREVMHLQPIVIIKEENILKMDIHTKRNLELVENIRLKDRNFSLLWLLDNTKTASGSRLLKRWIENPIVDKKELNKRYDVIASLLDNFLVAEELRTSLKSVYDIERLSSRIAFNTANGRDLIQLKKTLANLPIIKKCLDDIGYDEKIEVFDSVFELLEASINEDAPVSIKEGYLIKEGYNNELDELKKIKTDSKSYLLRLEEEEKAHTGIKNLKIAYNKVFGYYIEISKGQIASVKDEFGFIRKQTLANCERFITNELKELEDKILSAEEKLVNLEYQLFIDLRDKLKEYIPSFQKTASIISKIDVLQSFSYVSETNRYVRPNLIEEKIVKIIDGRHPVVEKVLKGEYISNDVIFDEQTDILLVTGPNMAGKSTFMRQLAIIVVMAQIGCYVPAREANMFVFDKIFTRIGASDDLVSGESTFMVEMMEANNALRNATKNSLILFDELGRGTATYDGMAIASAILEYLDSHVKAKTIFSTHYHELTKLDKTLLSLKNVHVKAIEEDGKITFLHKVYEGSVDKSYGIHVAALASLPSSLITRANEILIKLENNSNNASHKEQLALPLYIKEESEVENILKNINPLEITPMDALSIVNNLVDKVKQ